MSEATVRVRSGHKVESGSKGDGDTWVPRSQWSSMQGAVFCSRNSYCTNINPMHPRDEWSYEDELEMI